LSEITLDGTGVLPLAWTQVMAQRKQNNAVVQWTTSQEVNVSHFSVERKVYNDGWRTVTNNIQAHNTGFHQQYTYIDSGAIGKVAYRIRQTDWDGKFTYSQIVTLPALSSSSAARIYPNPVTREFTMQLSKPATVKTLQLYHSSGWLVRNWHTPQTSYTIEHLPAGVYQLCIIEKDGTKHYLPLIKN
jgi:hypothetical protein